MERNVVVQRAVVFIWREIGKTVKEEPPIERVCLEAPKEFENRDNAIREDEGANF